MSMSAISSRPLQTAGPAPSRRTQPAAAPGHASRPPGDDVRLGQPERGKPAGKSVLRGLEGTYGAQESKKTLAERGLPDNGRRLPKNPKEGDTYQGYVMQYPISKQQKMLPGETTEQYQQRQDKLQQKYFRVGEPPADAEGYHGGWRGAKVKPSHFLPYNATFQNGKWVMGSQAD